MLDPIGNIGDSPGLQLARIGGAPAPTDAGSGQLGQMLSLLSNDFSGSNSPDQLATILGSARLVVGTGLPALDVADAMYSNPLVVDAMRDGNPDIAKQAVVSQLTETLASLRASGAPEANLQTLSASGFAAGEISSALRTVPSLREGLAQGDPAALKQTLSSLHDTFREDGRSMHGDPSVLAALGERMVPGLSGAQETWFERYMNRIRAAQKRTVGEFRPEDHPELMLFSGPAQVEPEESDAIFGAWIIAFIIAAAALLIIASRC
jgi:hypothetical protein